jgi:hypothetical protein
LCTISQAVSAETRVRRPGCVPGAQGEGRRVGGPADGALNEPDIRARLVSSQDRVCELNYGQVTLQGLKAVMIHDRSQ